MHKHTRGGGSRGAQLDRKLFHLGNSSEIVIGNFLTALMTLLVIQEGSL